MEGVEMFEERPNVTVAILIVNGGEDPNFGRWIDLCIEKIREHSRGWDYRVFVWDNNNDSELAAAMVHDEQIDYMESAPYEQLGHVHAHPLQRLYERALLWSPKYIITLDSDAFPIRDDWLGELTRALEGGNVLSGVWRDELKEGIDPYIHASCLCTTPGYVNRFGLRFDFIAPAGSDKMHDTLSDFTENAVREGLSVYPLRRSNKNEFHWLMGGIYGDLIYHHGAGSRNTVRFHGDGFSKEASHHYRMLRNWAADALFNDYAIYIGWLRGTAPRSALQVDLVDQRSMDDALNLNLEQVQGRCRPDAAVIRTLKRSRDAFRHRVGPGIDAVRNRLPSLIRQWSSGAATLPKAANRAAPSEMTRPFGYRDLARLPKGWTETGPDFVGVGVPKAGTSWFYSLLLQHPQIVPNRVLRGSHPLKETHYFVHFADKPLPKSAKDVYKDAFARPSGAVCGEFSTTYLQYPGAIRHLAECAPDTKIIVLLRNPVDRMVSGMNHLSTHRARRLGITQDSNDWIFLTKNSWRIEAHHYSLYARAIQALLESFPRQNIEVVLYEELVEDPMTQVRHVVEGLGLRGGVLEMSQWHAVNRFEYVVSKPTEVERHWLATEFKSDVEHLKSLLPDVDFSKWKEFS